jgi:hypothetical protein
MQTEFVKSQLWPRAARAPSVRLLATLLSLVSVIGVATYLGVHSVGMRQIDPTNLGWLSEDPATVFFGSHSYRLAADFSPLAFRTDLFGYPGSISISLFDPIPIFAFLVRLFSPILPMPFQYDGLYLALCFVLQGVAGWALMREILGQERVVTTAVASLLLVMTPPFVTRTYGHVALSSHWAILVALALYFRGERRGTMQWAAFTAIIVVAAGINVYISIISLCIFVASAINHLWRAGNHNRTISGFVATGIVMINLAAFNFFGYVTASDWPIMPTNDLGIYSANLLTFISAPGQAILFRPQAIDPAQQGEGFGYLGLGTLLLTMIAVARDPRGVGTTMRRFAPLVAAGVALFAFATIDRVRFGSTTLLTIPLPNAIRGIVGSLHANGRFVWLSVYLIPVIAIAVLARTLKPRALLLILGAAGILQALEVIPLINGLRTVHEYKSDEYEEASSLHFSPAVRDFIVLPPWQCGGTPGPRVPGHGTPQATFQSFVSILNNLRSNSQYTARIPYKTRQPWCDSDIVARLGVLRSDSVYYFSQALYKQTTSPNRSAQWCDLLYDGVLCRPDAPQPGESEAARSVREH